MRLGSTPLVLAVLLCTAGMSVYAAWIAADIVEDRSSRAVANALTAAGHDWATVNTDGLQVHIGGEAETEATRFNALSVSGTVVDASRLVDGTTVRPAQPIAAPDFSVEILRNEEGISLIGLVPSALNPDALVEEVLSGAEGMEVTSFVETANHPVPAGWVEALHFGLDAIATLPRSKVSVAPGQVAVTAISDSIEEQRRLETALARQAPDTVRLALSISAPRPVVTPFTLRFRIGPDGARFDTCTADNVTDRDRIIRAARAAGLAGPVECALALGVPSPDWAQAVELAIGALTKLGAGSISFSDADVVLVAGASTTVADFDAAVGDLESNLPDVFSLASRRIEPAADSPNTPAAVANFSADLAEDGRVELRGRLPNETMRTTVTSVARAFFGVESVYQAARLDADLPEDWAVRALAGLRGLAALDHGTLMMEADRLRLSGVSGNRTARNDVAAHFDEALGQDAQYTLQIRYDAALDPLADLPTPEACLRKITAIQEAQKITFAPGSTSVEGANIQIVDEIAEVLRGCREVEMSIEIAGHTDSQGRESMNLDLSEARAKSVLDFLVERRVSISKLASKGYGESKPIADNDTDEGREANRRIEFRLVLSEDETETETADASEPDEGEGEGTPPEPGAEPEADPDSEDANPDATEEAAE